MKKKPNAQLPFTRFFKGKPQKLRDYWKKMMSSTREEHMSRGAIKISRIITWARKDNWRRGREKKK